MIFLMHSIKLENTEQFIMKLKKEEFDILHFSHFLVHYFMCMSVFQACMSMHVKAWCPWLSEEGIRFPGTRVVSCHVGVEN